MWGPNTLVASFFCVYVGQTPTSESGLAFIRHHPADDPAFAILLFLGTADRPVDRREVVAEACQYAVDVEDRANSIQLPFAGAEVEVCQRVDHPAPALHTVGVSGCKLQLRSSLVEAIVRYWTVKIWSGCSRKEMGKFWMACRHSLR